MANCPYFSNGCCKNAGMLMTSALLGAGKNRICRGHQVQGLRYTGCPHYVKPNQGISENMKHCPLAKRLDYGSYYKALCYSKKLSETKDGKNGIEIKEPNGLAICLGKTINGKRYTSCPYYYRVSRSVENQKAYEKKKNTGKLQTRSTEQLEGRSNDATDSKVSLLVVAACLIIAFMICRAIGIL